MIYARIILFDALPVPLIIKIFREKGEAIAFDHKKKGREGTDGPIIALQIPYINQF